MADKFFNLNAKDKHVFAYCRVSTSKQFIENQYEEIKNYADDKNFDIPINNIFSDNAISGAKCWLDRKTNDLYKTICDNGVLIIVEISRLGRNASEVIELLSMLFRKNIMVHDIKNELIFNNFDNDMILMKVFCLSMFCQVEKNAIRKRIKEAVNNSEHKKPNKLDQHIHLIKQFIKDGLNANQITNSLSDLNIFVNKSQVYRFIKIKKL